MEKKYEVVTLDGEQYLVKDLNTETGCLMCCFAKESGEANTCKYANTCMAHLREDRRSVYYKEIDEYTLLMIKKQWNEDDLMFLIKNYSTMKAPEIAKKLNLPVNRVYHKARELNLKKELP